MRRVVEALRAGRRFLLPLHRQPDGDSIGASLAMALALGQLGKEALVVTPDPVGPLYAFLPGSGEIRGWDQIEGAFDAVVLLDCADGERAGAPRPLEAYGRPVVNVDHHATNRGYGDITFIDPLAAAVGEIALRLIDELGVVLEPDAALCLYTAIATDTGNFRYASTTPHTHRVAARLLDTGLDAGEISEHLYEQDEASGVRLLGLALQSLRVEREGRVALLRLTEADLARAGAVPADAESLAVVNYARAIRGVEVGVLLREEPQGIRVSLRSRGAVDVGRVAVGLGGGGHARAAGVTLGGGLDDAEAAILAALAPELG